MFTKLGNRRRDIGRAGPAGFTLVEILIVVVILGILATVVLPQFSNASMTAKENTLKDELRYLRTQIIVYKAQHHDTAPGDDGNEATFIDQMTKYTDEKGNVNATATTVFKFGPYLSKIPKNPVTGDDKVEMSTQYPLVADGGHGWKYNPATQEVIADMAGNDSTGTAYAKY
jgi:general secretion pathway protein G